MPEEFPLYLEAVKFFNHRDQMVRATVRTITLQVYKVEHEQMRAFVLNHAAASYFSELALHLKDLWMRFNVAALARDGTALQRDNDLQQDLLLYLADMFDLGIGPMNQVLAERLLAHAIVPVLLTSLDLREPIGLSPSPASERARLEPRVALFLVRQVLDTIRWPMLAQPLAGALLLHKVPDDILPWMPPDAPLQFHSTFVNFLKGGDDAALVCAAGILDIVVQHRPMFPPSFLEEARIVPPSLSSKRAKMQPPLLSEHNLDVPYFLLLMLQRPGWWRSETFRILLLLIAELFLDPLLATFHDIRGHAENMARGAACQVVAEVIALLQDKRLHQQDGRQQGDGLPGELLDIFVEEWRERDAPAPRLTDLCLDAWRLLADSAGGEAEERPPPREYARRIVKAFVHLRALMNRLEQGRGEQPAASAVARLAASPFPWANWTLTCTDVRDIVFEAGDGRGAEVRAHKRRAILAETAQAEAALLQASPSAGCAFQEGMPLELGALPRLPCRVLCCADGGERLLVLHGSYLVLARPQNVAPGRALVTTVWPLQQVQPLPERGEPRTLQLFLQALTPGKPPGDSVEVRGAGGRGVNFAMAVTFQDVESCHQVVLRLQRGRAEVRAQLLQQVVSFLEAWREQQGTVGAMMHL